MPLGALVCKRKWAASSAIPGRPGMGIRAHPAPAVARRFMMPTAAPATSMTTPTPGQGPTEAGILPGEPPSAFRVPEARKFNSRVEVENAYIREEQPMTRVRRITRRRALKVTAGAVGATLPLVHVQSATPPAS